MSTLSEKMRRARESVVSIGGFAFTIRRPTEMDMVDFGKTRRPTDLIRHVVGWDKVAEMDLYSGGDAGPAAFDADARDEWLMDRTDLMAPLVNAILEAYQQHQSAREDAAKN